MPPLTDDDEYQWDTPQNTRMLARIASVSTQTLINQYSFHDVFRLIKVTEAGSSDDDSTSGEEPDEVEEDDGPKLEAKSDDPLASLIVESLEQLESTSREGGNEFTISPASSVAGLFTKDSKTLKGRLFLGFDLGSETVDCVAALTACSFTQSDEFLTKRFSPSYLRKNSLPDLSSYMLIDTLSSQKKPVGQMLLLHAYIAAMRQYQGIVMVCVTAGGKAAGRAFGMHSHSYREDGAARELMYMAIGDLSIAHLNKKLRLGSREATTKLLQEVCTRSGLTSKTESKVFSRC